MDKSLYEHVFTYLDNLSFFYGIDMPVDMELMERISDLDFYIKQKVKEVIKNVQ